uniref:Long-chain-fatty-acid--CoA ligase n=1 Tax=Syphacia muris TaxID=451379 RepID=A0A0N5AZZ6_9BILA
MASRWHRRLYPLVDLKHQSRVLPDGSRIAAMFDSYDELSRCVFEDAKTFCEACQRGCRESKNGPMLGYRKKQPDGTEPYVWLSYKEIIDRSYDFTYGLMDIGLKLGQKTFIGIYAKNRPEVFFSSFWIITELGTYNNRCVLIPLYETLGPEACSYIINESEMQIVVCDSQDKAEKLLKNRKECPSLKYILIMDDYSDDLKKEALEVGVLIYKFSEIERRGHELTDRPSIDPCTPDDLCTICYTSGTTGKPKGVMLTHENYMACCTCLRYLKNSCFYHGVSFLPLAHMFERLVEAAAFQVGASVGYFRGDVRELAADIKELRPTIIPLVPRVLNRIYDKVMSEVEKSFLKKTLFDIALTYKSREYHRGIVRNDSLFDKIAFKKIQNALGGRVKLMITGSAPISENVLRFARAALGCIVIEGYGQTECVAACSLALEADCEYGHVGIPTPCNAIKLVDVPELGYFAKDQVGEVCIRGYNVFKGYYKNEELTKEVLEENGWLHTGDIGKWTSAGTLKIIDRKKHIFKLAQGEYVAPEHIENVYARSRYVAQSFIYGESLKTCVIGVVVPDFEILYDTVAERLGMLDASHEEMCRSPEVKEVVFEDMIAVGKKAGLYSFQQVKDIYLCSEQFSMENGLLTPTLKSKRPELKKRFITQIEKMYSKLN